MRRAQVLFLSVLLTFVGLARDSWGGTEPPEFKHTASLEGISDDLLDSTHFLLDTKFGKSKAAPYLSKIEGSAGWFRYWDSARIALSEQFLVELSVDAALLDQVVDAVRENPKSQPTKWLGLLQDVADDLNTKLSFVGRFIQQKGIHVEVEAGAAPGGKGGREGWHRPPVATIDQGVRVTVATRDKTGKEVSNYEVWFCLKGLINYKDRYVRFDRLSSPADYEMTPGNYAFWTQKGSDQGTIVSINDVGADGKDRQIDLPIP